MPMLTKAAFDSLCEAKAQRDELFNGIHELRIYLQSDKFLVDTTVQAADVLRRLDEICNAAHNAAL